MSAIRYWFPLTGAVGRFRGATVATSEKKGLIDPLSGPKLALGGRVVTMDDTFSIKKDAVVYIDKGAIVAVQDRAKPVPDGFAGVTIVESGGTIFPGLIMTPIFSTR